MHYEEIAMIVSHYSIAGQRGEAAVQAERMWKPGREEDYYRRVSCIDLRSKSLACQLSLFVH